MYCVTSCVLSCLLYWLGPGGIVFAAPALMTVPLGVRIKPRGGVEGW